MAVWQFEVALEPNALPSGSNGPPSEPDRGGLFGPKTRTFSARSTACFPEGNRGPKI